MKKLLTAIAIVLALNFLVVSGFVGFLFKSGKLDREKVGAIKEIVFPSSQPATTQAVEFVEEEADKPVDRLGLLIAQKSQMDVAAQTEFVKQTYNAQLAEIDRRKQELSYREANLAKLQDQVAASRKELDDARADFQAKAAVAEKLASDKGFQETLDLYTTMKAAQAKALLATMDDDTIVNYLQAMEPSTSTKIMAEFKTPEESARLSRLMTRLRAAVASTAPAKGQ